MTWYRKGEVVGNRGTDDWYLAFERYVDDTYEPHEILRMCSDDGEDYESMFLDWVLDSIRESREAFSVRFGFEWRDE